MNNIINNGRVLTDDRRWIAACHHHVATVIDFTYQSFLCCVGSTRSLPADLMKNDRGLDQEKRAESTVGISIEFEKAK